MTKAKYVIQRCRMETNEFYGPKHYADIEGKTLCGKETDENWYILDNGFHGKSGLFKLVEEVTCKKCLKAIEDTKEN